MIALALGASGQEPREPLPLRTPARAPIDTYIHQAWQSLRRSMNECGSLVDPKVKTRPVLYLPVDLPEPADVAALPHACDVRVERLPVKIERMGQKLPPLEPGLLYLPNTYIVPGGRFNEMYGWDSYFMILGLIEDGQTEMAQGIVENFFFEIKHYGGVLNANRTYYLTRSQPPFLSSMIRAVWKAELRAGHRQEADAWLATAYGFAQRDHAFWMRPEMRAGDTGLQRYWDFGSGPVPEMGDDPTYYRTVIRWLLAHPGVRTDYLVDGPAEPMHADWPRIMAISCNPATSPLCSREHVGTHWLTRDFYKGDRAMRESGFDTTFRFGPFGGSTQDYAPVGLNALLYKYEMDLAWMAEELGRGAEAQQWDAEAEARRAAMDRYLWNAQKGMYFDYDFATGKQSKYDYLTTFYPLWAGAASAEQARRVESNLELFEQKGGPAMSSTDSGEQWDLPYGWAPTTWLAADGMAHEGDRNDALRVARAFTTTVRDNYQRRGTVREKYNVVTGSSEFQVLAGYRQNVVGFGWTNAVYERLEEMLRGTELPKMPRPRGRPIPAFPNPRQ
ncbi:MAG TPA: trehalase family glycosidase [Acidobacteriaceae bacterium]|nr:trehalase family glycosidase [Acidobacteriaceae bacterium]